MNRKRRARLRPDLTPLIDVVFLLLIFFMVVSVFKKKESILELQLPTSESGAPLDPIERITLELTESQLAYNAKIIAFEELDQALLNIDREKRMLVSIDKDTRYERVARVLDILSKHRLEKVDLEMSVGK